MYIRLIVFMRKIPMFCKCCLISGSHWHVSKLTFVYIEVIWENTVNSLFYSYFQKSNIRNYLKILSMFLRSEVDRCNYFFVSGIFLHLQIQNLLTN